MQYIALAFKDKNSSLKYPALLTGAAQKYGLEIIDDTQGERDEEVREGLAAFKAALELTGIFSLSFQKNNLTDPNDIPDELFRCYTEGRPSRFLTFLSECAQALKELWSQHAFALTIDPAHFQEIRFDLQTYLSTKENAGTTEQLDRVKADILRFHQMLRLSLPDVAVKWETEVRTLEALDPFRLGLIRESLQLEAANARSLAAWDETYREQLAEYLRQLGDDDSAETLRPKIHDLTRMPIIRESDFVKLDQEIQDHLTTRYAKEQSQATGSS
jgi:hypothetical protein